MKPDTGVAKSFATGLANRRIFGPCSKIEGDHATVETMLHNKDGSTVKTTFYCVKEDGKWGISSGM